MFFSSGVVSRRWRQAGQDARCDIDIVIRANHIQVTNEQRTNVLLTQEQVLVDTLLLVEYLRGKHLLNVLTHEQVLAIRF